MISAALPIAAAPLPMLAFLDSIGGLEMVLVAFVGLLLFGGKGLPDMARTVGKVVREFKKATASVENEVKRVMDEEPETKPRPRPKPRALPSPVNVTPSPPSSIASLSTPPPSAPSSATPPSTASELPRDHPRV